MPLRPAVRTRAALRRHRLLRWRRRALGGGTDVPASVCDKFARISGADEAMAEGVERGRMRQVAHICVTLRHSRDRNDAEIAAVRAFCQPKIGGRIAKMAKGRAVAKAYAESTSPQMLQGRCTRRATPSTPGRPLSPPASPSRRRFAGTDSHGRMDPPKISLTIKRLTFS
jgi:hypothetical protein